MEHRKESVCVFANGNICIGPSGATFESDRVKIIKVNSNITLGKLKEVIGQKLRLPPSQIVANLTTGNKVFHDHNIGLFTTTNRWSWNPAS